MGPIWVAVKGLLGSKKALMAVLSAIAWAVGHFGLSLEVQELVPLVAPLWMYIFAQGAADLGKSKAEVHASADLVEDDDDEGP
jgi:hypothetical protein